MPVARGNYLCVVRHKEKKHVDVNVAVAPSIMLHTGGGIDLLDIVAKRIYTQSKQDEGNWAGATWDRSVRRSLNQSVVNLELLYGVLQPLLTDPR